MIIMHHFMIVFLPNDKMHKKQPLMNEVKCNQQTRIQLNTCLTVLSEQLTSEL